jgi:stage V sporulation protein D (sporulation-specific penicillin-binding protein)
MRNKLFVVFALIIVMTGYIGYNLVNTAIIDAEYYRARANAQQMRRFTIPANRGTIFDRNGKILAQSKTVWNIVISPTTIRENAERYQTQRHNAAVREYRRNIEEGLPAVMPAANARYDEAHEISHALAEIFDLDYNELMNTIRESNLGYEYVIRQVDKAEVDRLNEFKSQRGIGVYSVYAMESTKRFYPNGSLAANVIGFTNFDNIGVYGVEARYDNYLQGINGLFVMARDANNQPMPYDYEMRYEARNGHNVFLTIDEVLQHYLEKNLEITHSQHRPDNRVTGIMMEAKTGAVLAMATYPSFDLNEPAVLSELDHARLAAERTRKINDTLIINGFSHGTEFDLTTEQVAKIDNDIRELGIIYRETQWKNKAVSELYFPGSVFKVITLAAALEEHVVGLNSGFYCGSYTTIADRKIHCWNSGGHGQINGVTEAITLSCNPAFIEIGRVLGAQKFTEYFEAFGFTRRTGIDLPGEAGSIFLTRERMGAVELASSSFGQTNKITPLQMITAYAAAVNGGHLVTPYVVDRIIDNDGNIVHSAQPKIRRQVISEETSALMRQILEDVVEYNGGTNAYIAGYRIGGKSGTSQKIDEYEEGEAERYVGSFGAFTPANDPEIIMLVMVDDPRGGYIYGSAVAAPVVAAVFKETLPYLEIYPSQLSEEELLMQETAVPPLIGLTWQEAQARLNELGLNYKPVGEIHGNRVLYTVPVDGRTITRNGTVVVYMSEQDYNMSTVPNVRGMSPARANEVITGAGLNIRLTGAIFNSMAEAIYQSLEPGLLVAEGTVIEVDFTFVDGHTG